MALRPIKIRVGKKDREAVIEMLRENLSPGQAIFFMPMNSHEYDWQIVAPIRNNAKNGLLGLSRLVAAMVNRPHTDGVLRGVQYDSPEIILTELQGILEFKSPFKVGGFSWG